MHEFFIVVYISQQFPSVHPHDFNSSSPVGLKEFERSHVSIHRRVLASTLHPTNACKAIWARLSSLSACLSHQLLKVAALFKHLKLI